MQLFMAKLPDLLQPGFGSAKFIPKVLSVLITKHSAAEIGPERIFENHYQLIKMGKSQFNLGFSPILKK